MNKTIIFLPIVLVGLLFLNCKKNEPTLEKSFKKTPLISEEIIIDNSFFANPSRIEIIDTIMLFVDIYEEKCFTAIDLKNKSVINRFGTQGRGPGELSYPADLTYNKQERTVSFSIRNPTRYWDLNIKDITNSDISFNDKFKFKNERGTARFLSIAPIRNSNGKLFSSGMFSGGMYGICQSDGTLDTIIGYYTAAKEHLSIDSYLLGSGYQGMVKSNPVAPFVAYVSYRHDLVEVIDCSNDNYKIIRFHGGNYPILSVGNNVSMALNQHHPLSFMDLCTTDKYIYALYSGKTIANKGHMAGHGKLVYVFDWKLKPVICYELDHEITSIKVSEDDQTLYSFALNKEDKMALMHWDLNHL